MKKFAKSFFVAAAAFLLFAGCSNIADDDVTVSGMTGEGESELIISIDDLAGSSSRSASRMINPTPYTIASTFDSIKLTGISETQDTINEVLTFTGASATSSGTASVRIRSGIWYLTLSAYVGDDIVLQGKQRVNVKAGLSPISFSLKADGLTTPGGIDITLNFASTVDTSLIASAKAFLYNFGTGTLVDDDDAASATAVHYTNTSVAPGRYSFVVEYYNSENTKIGVWGDVVAVASGRTSTSVQTLPNILAQRPNPPTHFRAYRVNNSETVDGHYQVLFTWQRDDLRNEESFEITLKTYENTTATNSTDYKIFGSYDENDTANNKYIFFQSPECVAGKLNATEESCIITLPTGMLFDATIQAHNFVGYSDDDPDTDGIQATPREAADANATGTITGVGTVPANTFIGSEKINRAKVVFNLNGGSYKSAEDSIPVTGSITKFGSYSDTTKTLAALLPVSSTDYPSLKIDSTRPFTNWQDGTGASASEVTAYDFEDLVVYANYSIVNAAIGYTVVDEWGTISATVSATGSLAAFNTTTKTLEVNAASNPNLVFTLTNTTDVTEISYNIDNEIGSQTTGSSITFEDTESLGSRMHTVVVAAKKGGKWYGDVIYVKILR